MFGPKYLVAQQNSLEKIALKKYPKLKKIKFLLENINNPLFVRMSGSGSAIIAYFNSDKKCKEAEKKVNKQFRNYWCKTSKTI